MHLRTQQSRSIHASITVLTLQSFDLQELICELVFCYSFCCHQNRCGLMTKTSKMKSTMKDQTKKMCNHSEDNPQACLLTEYSFGRLQNFLSSPSCFQCYAQDLDVSFVPLCELLFHTANAVVLQGFIIECQILKHTKANRIFTRCRVQYATRKQLCQVARKC